MNIEALCLGDTSGQQWVDLKPDFRGIYHNEFLGSQMSEAKSSLVTGLFKPGIHLHWALPDGLTHGSKTSAGDLEFPHVPNRWLVVRFWDEKASPSRFRAWLVESDAVTGDDSAQSWPRLRNIPSKEDSDYCVFVGRKFDFDKWQENPSAERVAITAVGYGDPAFAASYTLCRGILGFHDPLDDRPQNVTLNYFVAGWYSSAAEDPLNQTIAAGGDDLFKTLDAFLAEKRWIYPGFAETREKAQQAASLRDDIAESKAMAARLKGSRGAAELQAEIEEKEREAGRLEEEISALRSQLPAEIICHGTILNMAWQTEKTRYDTGIPDRKLKVSAGDSVVEALCALFNNQKPEVVELLQAFQYDLLSDLEKPGGRYTFDRKVHEKSFRPLARGIAWDLITEGKETEGEKTPPIPGDIRLLLENVNARQRKINRLKREGDATRSRLYAAWYRKVFAGGTPEDSAEIDGLTNEIREFTNQIEILENENARDRGELEAKAAVLAPSYLLQQVDEPRFWRPADPVVLLAGPACRPSARHGEDGRYREDGRLLCRLTGMAVTGAIARISGVDRTLGPEDLDTWCNPFANRKPAPEVVDLFRESLLLTLDSKGASAAPQKIRDLAGSLEGYLKTVLVDPSTVPPPGVELTGAIPSPIMLNRWTQNPWLPLFLQWQVTWLPAYSDSSKALENWELSSGGTVFNWKNGAPAGNEEVYAGTTLLTASATWTFSERLRQYNLVHETPGLRTLQANVRSMSVLCQSLFGFTDNLLMRKAYQELRPLDAGTGDTGPRFSPVFDEVRNIDWLAPLVDQSFFAVRAGHLRITSLRVVDAFGRFVDVDGESLRSIALPPRLRGPSISNAVTIRMEPRLAQSARFTVDWPPASDEPEAGPVCGWILPNFLDEGLMLYDAQGNALGSLQAVKRKAWAHGAGGKTEEIEGFHWVGLPGNSTFYFGPLKDPPLGPEVNRHLRDFVNGLLALKRSSSEALMQSLSLAGSGQNPNLALLFGKPLALVRASISIELDGGPARAQGLDERQKSLEEQSRGIEALAIPLRLGDRREWLKDLWLGDDGLVGFFRKGADADPDIDYTRFFPAFGLTGTSDNYLTYGESPAMAVGRPLEVTLLMDPARGFSVASGILPRQIFQLPYDDLAETLEHKHVIFYTGPVVGPRPETTNPKIRMPRPSDIYGQWSWTHHPDVDVWRDVAIDDTVKDDGYFSDDPPAIAEGWLKLVTAPLEVRVFTVIGKNPIQQSEPAVNGGGDQPPQEFAVERGPQILSWAVTGADKIELWQDGGRDGDKVLESSRHPLPAQIVLEVTQDVLFTLVVTARPDRPLATGRVPESTSRSIKLKTGQPL
jgi:hypothetical protein